VETITITEKGARGPRVLTESVGIIMARMATMAFGRTTTETIFSLRQREYILDSPMTITARGVLAEKEIGATTRNLVAAASTNERIPVIVDESLGWVSNARSSKRSREW
jgi:hypothetical protein